MGHQEILNLLNGASDSWFVTRKWNIVNDQSSDIYVVGNEFIYNTEVLKSNYCDYNDTFILPRGGCYYWSLVALKKVHHLVSTSQNMIKQH